MIKFKPIKKASKMIFVGLLTASVVIGIGFLAYSGMLLFTSLAVFTWGAFVNAGIVDGEVFLQNTNGGVKNTKLLYKDHGLRAFISQALDEQLTTTPDEYASAFEKEYHALREYVRGFIEKELTAEQKKQFKESKKRLRYMQNTFAEHILHPHTALKNISHHYYGETNHKDNLLYKIKTQLPTFKRKMHLLYASVPISALAGIGFCFATASGLITVITAAAFVWPLAIMAGIGFAFLMYHTFSSILLNDTVKAWREKIKRWFARNAHEEKNKHDWKTNLRYWGKNLLIGSLIFIAVSIGILATLATAGTWWLAVQNGAALIRPLSMLANGIRSILVPVSASANLIFTTRNILETVDNAIADGKKFNANAMKQVIHSKINAIKPANLRKAHPEKSWLALYNPFRILIAIISFPFMALMLIGHFISIGITGDRAPGLSYGAMVASAAIGAVADTLVDYEYLLGKEPDPKTQKPGEKHSHGTIAKILLNVLLAPLILGAAVIDFAVSKNTSDEKPLQRFLSTLKNNIIGRHKHETYTPTTTPEPSSSYLKMEAIYRIEERKHELSSATIDRALAQNKKEALTQIQNEIMSDNPNVTLIEHARATTDKPREIASPLLPAALKNATKKETTTGQMLTEIFSLLKKSPAVNTSIKSAPNVYPNAASHQQHLVVC